VTVAIAADARSANAVSDGPVPACSALSEVPAPSPRLLGGSLQGAQLYDHGDPTAEEQLMLELVNRARANPSGEAARFGIDLNEGLTGDPISAAPKPPLAFNPQLIEAARAHSQWMLDQDVFAHVETNGSDPGSRMRAAGYAFIGNWTYGENLAWRGTTGTLLLGPTVAKEHEDLFVDEDIPDRGHRRNLMNAAFREIGIGALPGIFTMNATDYNSAMVTQDFATSDANPGPFLVGVVYRDGDADGAYSVGEGLAGVTVMPARGSYHAVSSTSGGYALPVTGLTGALPVTFSGGILASPITKSINLTGHNVKLDFEFNVDSVPSLSFVPGSVRFSPSGQFDADLTGPADARVSIRRSEDLRTWTEIQQITLSRGTAHVTDPSAPPDHTFYRAVGL
jgi:hypothetical protein